MQYYIRTATMRRNSSLSHSIPTPIIAACTLQAGSQNSSCSNLDLEWSWFGCSPIIFAFFWMADTQSPWLVQSFVQLHLIQRLVYTTLGAPATRAPCGQVSQTWRNWLELEQFRNIPTSFQQAMVGESSINGCIYHHIYVQLFAYPCWKQTKYRYT